jgi:hypothetical protein
LEGKSVDRWTKLEDLALAMSESSPQFSVLLQTKGAKKIQERRSFLKADPVWAEDIKSISNAEEDLPIEQKL